MSTVSGRYGGAIAALLAAALVPVAINTLKPRRHDPCRNPGALIATSLIPGTRPEGEEWERRKDGVIQWSHGTVVRNGAPRDPFQFQIMRSYFARSLYHNTLSFAWKKVEAEDYRVLSVGGPGAEAPIHLVHDNTGQRSKVIGYLFAYGNRPISNPFLHQLAEAPRALIFGQEPLTLILVYGTSPRRRTKAADAAERRFLANAWSFYRRSCILP